MNLSTVKWAQWDETQSRDLLGLFICVCIALSTIIAHNIAQNRPDNFPSYPPDSLCCGSWHTWKASCSLSTQFIVAYIRPHSPCGLSMKHWITHSCLHQGGHVFVVVCLSVCMSVSNFAQKLFQTDLHKIFREGWQRANEQTIKFWWRSGSHVRIWMRIATKI